MPVGATIGAAVIGAGASIYSSSQASSAQSHAAQTASDNSLKVAQTNNAFAEHMYDRNSANLTPAITRGNTAGDALMSMLLGPAPISSGGTGTTTPVTGSPTPTPTPTPTPAPTPAPTTGGGALSNVISNVTTRTGTLGPPSWKLDFGDDHMPVEGVTPALPSPSATPNTPVALPPPGTGTAPTPGSTPTPTPTPTPSPTPTTGGTGTTPGPAAGGTTSALSGWDAFMKSASYTTPLNAGLAGIASQYAANGAFESGAEKKALDRYASDYASNALAGWMDRLYQQEALGVSAASSLAGVGTSLVSQVSANNTNAADAASNAALVAGQGSANNWNNVGSALGSAVGTIGGALSSSYHSPTPANDLALIDGTGPYSYYGYTG